MVNNMTLKLILLSKSLEGLASRTREPSDYLTATYIATVLLGAKRDLF